jgi:hypothetical protein
MRQIGVEFARSRSTATPDRQAFGNQYWPALYIFDSHDHLRHQRPGEQGYEDAERIIRQLPRRPDGDLAPHGRVDSGPEAPADWRNIRSSENYPGPGGPRTSPRPAASVR